MQAIWDTGPTGKANSSFRTVKLAASSRKYSRLEDDVSFAAVQQSATKCPSIASNEGLVLILMRILRLIFACLLSLSAVVPALAASDSADAPHVRVRLVVPAQGMTRGAATDAGLYFKLESGWHDYWKNHGDA